LDYFHDLAEPIAHCAEADAVSLRNAGYTCDWLMRTPTFYRAVVSKGNDSLKLEWAQDSAFRFFPLLEDAQCGYRLHEADAAINKVLALAGRDEVRDFVDILYLHSHCLSLGALAWAACGKDPGFTPGFLLQQANRHIAYTQADVDRLQLKSPLDLPTLKKKWIAARESAEQLVAVLPPDELGCLYLDKQLRPMTPEPDADSFHKRTRHPGCLCGAWPIAYEPDAD
jgi:hypothetical protein